MNIFIALLISIPLALILSWQWAALRRARHSEGKPAPDTTAVDDGIDLPHRVYFFHAAHCGPCHAVTPLVDRLRQEYPNLIKVDIADHPELARGFGVAATPSFITVTDGRIGDVRLGARSESWLRAQLGSGT